MSNTSQRSLDWRVRATANVMRALPQNMRGRWRMARAMLGAHVSSRDIRLMSRNGNVFLVPSLAEPVAFSLLVDGAYEPDTMAFIESKLPINGAFVDVGANVGLFAIEVASKLATGGKVLAIEASASVFAYLVENLRASGRSNVLVENVAVTAGDTEHTVFYEAPSHAFGMGSRAPQFHAAATSRPSVSLDELLRRTNFPVPDVIKVDVEGFEADVFRGGMGCLMGGRAPTVIFEFADWAEARSGGVVGAAQQLLLDAGYELRVLERKGQLSSALEVPMLEGTEMLVAQRN